MLQSYLIQSANLEISAHVGLIEIKILTDQALKFDQSKITNKSVCKFYSPAYYPSNYVLCHLFYTIKETLYEKINTKYPNTIAFQAK